MGDIHVKLISKPRLPLSNDCTQVTKESKLLCLYFIKQQKYSNTVGSMFEQDVICDLKYPPKWLNSRAD